jgi:pimeloyl-ACP methyl ester carboxylesterase
MLKRFVRGVGRMAFKVLAVTVLAVCLASAAGGVWALTHKGPPVRGQLIDIGDRRLRLVCEGAPSAAPLVVFEAGIYGGAADFGELQSRLAAAGVRSCAYDRAGLGFSDPDPGPRDGVTVVTDLEKLLRAAGETGPIVLVAHSMGGIHARIFAGRNPDQVVGLVLLDAMSPAWRNEPRAQTLVKSFRAVARAGDILARLGLMKVAAPFMGDRIGLTGPAHEEKRRFYGSAKHHRAARHEIDYASIAIDQAADGPPVKAAIPVAVVNAGPPRVGSPLAEGRVAEARRSPSGSVEHVPAANHTTLLGQVGGEVVTKAILRVVREATR